MPLSLLVPHDKLPSHPIMFQLSPCYFPKAKLTYLIYTIHQTPTWCTKICDPGFTHTLRLSPCFGLATSTNTTRYGLDQNTLTDVAAATPMNSSTLSQITTWSSFSQPACSPMNLMCIAHGPPWILYLPHPKSLTDSTHALRSDMNGFWVLTTSLSTLYLTLH